jgi:hypothetical protein
VKAKASRFFGTSGLELHVVTSQKNGIISSAVVRTWNLAPLALVGWNFSEKRINETFVFLGYSRGSTQRQARKLISVPDYKDQIFVL